jgi:hypothetical protein
MLELQAHGARAGEGFTEGQRQGEQEVMSREIQELEGGRRPRIGGGR